MWSADFQHPCSVHVPSKERRSRNHLSLYDHFAMYYYHCHPKGPDIKCFVIYLGFRFKGNKRITGGNQNSRLGLITTQI